MKKTKIICSVGPACSKVEVMQDMVLHGMDCARINLSHSEEKDILETIELIRTVRNNTGVPIAIMYDTKGPEFRTLNFVNGGRVEFLDGTTMTISAVIKQIDEQKALSDGEGVIGLNIYFGG